MFYPFSNLFMTSINRLLIILSVCSGRAGTHSSVRQMWGLSIYKAQQHGWLKCNNGKHKRQTQTKTSQSEIMVTNDHADFTALVLVATAHHRSHCVVHHGNRANMIVLQRRRQADRCIYISPIHKYPAYTERESATVLLICTSAAFTERWSGKNYSPIQKSGPQTI